MKIKLLGFEEQHYDLRNQGGPSFDGHKLFCEVLDEENDKLVGHTVTNIQLPEENNFAIKPEVGKIYICYFNQKKKLDYIRIAGDKD